MIARCAARGKAKRSAWVKARGKTITLAIQGGREADGRIRVQEIVLSTTGAQGVIDALASAIYEIEERTAEGRRRHEDERRAHHEAHQDLDQG
jgi:hypothetical protein